MHKPICSLHCQQCVETTGQQLPAKVCNPVYKLPFVSCGPVDELHGACHLPVLLDHPLQAPLALDALGSYVLVAFAPLELTLLRVAMTGALSPNGAPTATIHIVRELSIMSVGQPITVSPPQQAECFAAVMLLSECVCSNVQRQSLLGQAYRVPAVASAVIHCLFKSRLMHFGLDVGATI